MGLALQRALDCAVNFERWRLCAREHRGTALCLHREVVEDDGHTFVVNLGDGHYAIRGVISRRLCLHLATVEQVELLALGNVLVLKRGEVVGVEVDVEGLAVGVNHIACIHSAHSECVVVLICLGILLGIVRKGNLRGVDAPLGIVHIQLVNLHRRERAIATIHTRVVVIDAR